MRILISGYSGFVGQNLVKSLPNSDIHVVSRTPSVTVSDFKNKITWNEISVEHLNGVDVVIHLAGKAHDLRNTSVAEDYFIVNTGLTQKLFDLFLVSSAKDFIYFSSVKAAADKVEGILDESVQPKPGTAYGQSKLKAEEYLIGRKLPAGKRLFILRPCMIHGPGNKGNLNLLCRVIQKGVPYPLAAFENKRSFLSVENLNFIIKQILNNSAIPGGIYNVADDESLSTCEVIEIIGKGINKNPRLWAISPFLIKKIAEIGDTFHLPLNSERLNKLTESYVVDNAKIKKALNISSFPVSSRNGLLTTIRSFQNQ